MSLDGIKEQAYDAPGVYFKDADTSEVKETFMV